MLYNPSFSEGLHIEPQNVIDATVKQSLFFEGVDAPTFNILSMNAGHVIAENGNVRRANSATNTNSTVLRLSFENSPEMSKPESAFIFAADATEDTWEHIEVAYQDKPQAIRARYLLLSHHGSSQDGATKLKMLNIIKPEICFFKRRSAWTVQTSKARCF